MPLRPISNPRPERPASSYESAPQVPGAPGVQSAPGKGLFVNGEGLFQLKHALAFAASGLLTFFSLFSAVSGAEIVGPASTWIGVLLAINFALIVYLGHAVWRGLHTLGEGVAGERSGGRTLHRRLVGLFVLVGVLPAILISIFSALTIGRGVQAWFSEQVRGAVEATRNLADQSVNAAYEGTWTDLLAMAKDVNDAAPQLQANPSEFQAYLEVQADRRGFVAVYILDGNKRILASATRPTGVPPFVAPSDADYANATKGNVQMDERAIVRASYKLERFTDAYMSVVRLPEAGQLELLQQATNAVSAYQVIEERQGVLQVLFAMAYIETVLLVLIGATWLGLVSALRISAPIGRLALAAERVRAGDFSARVSEDGQGDEISALASTFNRMTAELQGQRVALEDARESAETRSAFIRAVLEGVSAGVVSLDEAGVVRAANGSAARLLRLEPQALEGQVLITLVPEFKDIVERARPGHPSQGQTDRMMEASTIAFDVRAAFAGDDLVVTFDDVSSLLAAQRQAAWKDVARRIAHEIKNPLTPIQLSAERLARKYAHEITGDKEAFLRMTNTIVRQVSDIGRMVDEFSSFARMPAPRFQVDDLAEAVRQAAFAQRITSPDIDVSTDTPPEPVPVSMDVRLITQALANLLKNAAESIATKRMQLGPESAAQIQVSLQMANGKAIVEIVDDGIGFPLKDRRRLLEPYMTTRAKGTGLGLAIVSRVLEEHGGGLELADRADNLDGACVRLHLPLAPQQNLNDLTSSQRDAIRLENAHGG
jgi:two-component system, NtrC family, nitrogen regulation sensor histidine kinase NtrY